MITKWLQRIKLMRISNYVLVITLSLSLVFAGFTVYGARVGNFNIYAHGSDVELAIYMEEDRSDLGTHLSVPVLDNMGDTTFESLVDLRNRITPGLGSKNDVHKKYLCFSFVLVNLSQRMVNYNAELTVIGSRSGVGGKKVEWAMRVMTLKERGYEKEGSIYEAMGTDEEQEEFFRDGRIYALPEETVEAKEHLERYTKYKTEDFISEVQIFRQEENDLEVGEEVKYTVLMWLEGWDMDCINDLYGGKIKMRLDIAGW